MDRYTVHVRSHPPGLVLLLWALQRVGLAGAGPVALLEVLGLAAAVPAALVAFREVAGEERPRAAAPFLALSPVAIFATSGEGLFAGVGAWAVALLVLATGTRSRRSDALALGGGLLFGAGLFLSYGLLLLGVVPVTVAINRRRVRPLLVGALGVAAVAFAFLLFGFWWVEGLLATRIEYARSVALTRPYSYFLVANVAAFAMALGPAVAIALGRLRGRSAWLLVAAGLVAAAAADLSGLSKGEAERIWLPFAPFLVLAACAFGEVRERRRWLALQAAASLALQLALVSPW
jgi:methylthioxylose transferase